MTYLSLSQHLCHFHKKKNHQTKTRGKPCDKWLCEKQINLRNAICEPQATMIVIFFFLNWSHSMITFRSDVSILLKFIGYHSLYVYVSQIYT